MRPTSRLRTLVLLATGAAFMALVLTLVSNPHALPAPTKKPWKEWSLTQKRVYVTANLRHAKQAVRWIRAHRHMYGRQLSAAERLIARHRALRLKATRNLAAIMRRLHPPWAVSWPWIAIVDCESGDGDGQPPYTAWWGYNLDFEGGPNFVYSTWVDYGGLAYASHAYYATPQQQIIVAERVLADVGWGAWPVCSVKVGVR